VGVGGIKEKDIVLAVAQELRKELLKNQRGREVIITREQDEFLTLEGRSSIANGVNSEKNPIFISIHANASFEKGTSGYETYFLTLDPVNEDAREVALMENSVFTSEIETYSDNLRQIMNRIVDVEYRRESMKLAELIQKRLEDHIGSTSSNRGVKSAFFYVMKAAKMPSVLVEIGFVTNREESSRLLQAEYRKKIAKGVAEGINDFITLFQRTEGFTNLY
jgi:N-acetylmuramoyl-L-alanine amidase